MRRLLFFLVLAMTPAACGEPTAADLVRESDRFQRELLRDSADAASVWNLFALDPIIDRLPEMGMVEVRADGRRRRWRAFVLERVFVRDDLTADSECPLVRRAIFGGKGGDGLIVVSADGPSAIRPMKECRPSNDRPGGGAPIHRGEAFAFVMSSGRQGVAGQTGTVDIRALGLVGACGFLDVRDDTNEPLDVTCEILRYALWAEATLAGGPSPSILPPGPRLLSIPHQELMGMRLTVRCNERSEGISGCERDYWGIRTGGDEGEAEPRRP